MNVPPLRLEDFPADNANCGNCTRRGWACPRQKSNKKQHNGNFYGFNGEVSGVIYCCPNYTGKYISIQKNNDRLRSMGDEQPQQKKNLQYGHNIQERH